MANYSRVFLALMCARANYKNSACKAFFKPRVLRKNSRLFEHRVVILIPLFSFKNPKIVCLY